MTRIDANESETDSRSPINEKGHIKNRALRYDCCVSP